MRNVSLRFYAKSKFCVCFEVHIPVRSFTNTKRKNCPKCRFFNLMNRPARVKINRKVAFFIQYSRTKKSKYCCHPPFHPPFFCRHSLKLLSPTFPKLMNWILLSPPPLSSNPDNPPNFGTCTRSKNFTVCLLAFGRVLFQ